jgi:predicted site-specific integrase-resolvase
MFSKKDKIYTIGEFAKKLGITVHTLRVWDKKNKLKPEYVSNGGHRYYSEEQLKELIPKLDVKTNEHIHVFSCRINGKVKK